MIITASGIPVEQYPLAKKVGLDTVWNGDAKVAARNGLWCIGNSDDVEKLAATKRIPSNLVGLNWGDDYPVDKLPGLEIRVQDAIRWTNIQWHIVLVSATYTRMLDYLGVDTIEEYYRAFAELCPSAIPMLCHYPVHVFHEEARIITEEDHWREYIRNLKAMFETFCPSGRNGWWAWVQVSAHEYYNSEWQFYELGEGRIERQVNTLVEHGCSGIGYFAWHPLEGDGIVDKAGEPSRHWETVKAINEEVGK